MSNLRHHTHLEYSFRAVNKILPFILSRMQISAIRRILAPDLAKSEAFGWVTVSRFWETFPPGGAPLAFAAPVETVPLPPISLGLLC